MIWRPILKVYFWINQRKKNHEVVRKLEASGYRLASKAQRFIQQVSAKQTAGRDTVRTEPHTRECQDLLEKCKYVG